MAKVLITDKLSAHALEVFRARGIEVEVAVGLAPEALIERIGAYDGLAVRSATKVTAAVLEGAHIVRVHQVREMVQVVRVADRIRAAGEAPPQTGEGDGT